MARAPAIYHPFVPWPLTQAAPLAALHNPLSYSMTPQSHTVRSEVDCFVIGEKIRDNKEVE